MRIPALFGLVPNGSRASVMHGGMIPEAIRAFASLDDDAINRLLERIESEQ